MNFTSAELIFAFSAIHGIVLGVLMCFSKKFKSNGNIYLGSVIILISTLILRELLERKEVIQDFQLLYINTWGLPILIGPLLYLYTRSTLLEDKYRKTIAWHFLIPMLYFVFLNYGIFIGITTSEATIDRPIIRNLYLFFQLFIVVQMPLYIVSALKIVRQHQKLLKEELSNIDKLSLRWLYYLLLGIGFIYLIWVVLFSGDIIIFNRSAATFPVNIVTVLLAVFIYAIGYFSLLRPEVFQVSLKRYRNKNTLNIDQSETEIWIQKITDVLEKEKIYLNQKLTVKDLALEINTTPKITSQVINSGFKKSFYDLINSYRIEEVKRNLKNEQYKHLTIEGIALNSGFNSSSTFNRLFKSYTGKTPKEYRSVEGFTH